MTSSALGSVCPSLSLSLPLSASLCLCLRLCPSLACGCASAPVYAPVYAPVSVSVSVPVSVFVSAATMKHNIALFGPERYGLGVCPSCAKGLTPKDIAARFAAAEVYLSTSLSLAGFIYLYI